MNMSLNKQFLSRNLVFSCVNFLATCNFWYLSLFKRSFTRFYLERFFTTIKWQRKLIWQLSAFSDLKHWRGFTPHGNPWSQPSKSLIQSIKQLYESPKTKSKRTEKGSRFVGARKWNCMPHCNLSPRWQCRLNFVAQYWQ